MAVIEKNGDIVQVTEGGYRGTLNIARKSMRLFAEFRFTDLVVGTPTVFPPIYVAPNGYDTNSGTIIEFGAVVGRERRIYRDRKRTIDQTMRNAERVFVAPKSRIANC